MQLDITRLTPYPGNPRRGNVDVIAESLQIHGQYKPVVVNKIGTQHVVVAGNHTVEAARKIGWERIDCHIITVSEESARKINLIDNRANDIAGYDADLLAGLLDQCVDLTGTGYTDDDLDKLLPDPDPEPDEQLTGDLQYRIVIDCDNETQQADLLARFEAEGIRANSLIS